jgi:hypothetical protein
MVFNIWQRIFAQLRTSTSCTKASGRPDDGWMPGNEQLREPSIGVLIETGLVEVNNIVQITKGIMEVIRRGPLAY